MNNSKESKIDNNEKLYAKESINTREKKRTKLNMIINKNGVSTKNKKEKRKLLVTKTKKKNAVSSILELQLPPSLWVGTITRFRSVLNIGLDVLFLFSSSLTRILFSRCFR